MNDHHFVTIPIVNSQYSLASPALPNHCLPIVCPLVAHWLPLDGALVGYWLPLIAQRLPIDCHWVGHWVVHDGIGALVGHWVLRGGRGNKIMVRQTDHCGKILIIQISPPASPLQNIDKP